MPMKMIGYKNAYVLERSCAKLAADERNAEAEGNKIYEG